MKKQIVPLFLVVIASITSCGPVTEKENPNAFKIEFNSNSIPKIADATIDDPLFGSEDWLHTMDKTQQGISARTDNPAINQICYGDTDVTHRWWPNSSSRQVVTGTLDAYRMRTDDDDDWNFYIRPIPPYERLLRINYEGVADWDFWASGAPSDLMPYDGTKLELEVCPPDGLRQNPWFKNDNSTLLKTGDTISAYGAWVTDGEHLFDDDPAHPEIHPVELLWWRKHLSDARSIDCYTMMVVQDASERFGSEDDYDQRRNADNCDDPTPWLESPLRATFRIAFVCDTLGPCLNYVIGEYGGMYSNVTTSSDPAMKEDQGPGDEIQVIFNGKKILSVFENIMVDDDLGIKVEDVGLRSDGKIQGFIQIKTRVGKGNGNDDKGYHVLYALKSEAPVSYLRDRNIFKNELPEFNLPRVNPNTDLTFISSRNAQHFVMAHYAFAWHGC